MQTRMIDVPEDFLSSITRTYSSPEQAELASAVASEILSIRLGFLVFVSYERIGDEYMLVVPTMPKHQTWHIADVPLVQKHAVEPSPSRFLVVDNVAGVYEPVTYPTSHTGLEDDLDEDASHVDAWHVEQACGLRGRGYEAAPMPTFADDHLSADDRLLMALIDEGFVVSEPDKTITCPDDALDVLTPLVWNTEQERFGVVAMDLRGRMIDAAVLTMGNLKSTIVDPAQVLRWVLTRERPAATFLVAHNHPSGNPEPSDQDIVVTERLRAAGETVGVGLLDHIVIGEGGTFARVEQDPYLRALLAADGGA